MTVYSDLPQRHQRGQRNSTNPPATSDGIRKKLREGGDEGEDWETGRHRFANEPDCEGIPEVSGTLDPAHFSVNTDYPLPPRRISRDKA